MSQASHAQVLNLLFRGKTISEVADMLEVSRTTIYNRRKDFLDYAKKEGILLAAENFGVEDTIQNLTDLAHLLESNGLTIEDAKKGSELVKKIESIGVKNTETFISQVIQPSIERKITGEEITKYAEELKILSNKEEKTYSTLIKEIEDIIIEKKKQEQNLTKIKEEIEKVKVELQNELNESETTHKKLYEFKEICKKLESEKIKIQDIDRLNTLISNFRQHDYKLEEIINFYENTLLLKESIEKKKEINNRLEKKYKETRKENDKIEAKLQENIALHSSIKNLKKSEIKPEDILEIKQIITRISNELGLSKREAFEKFLLDIKTEYNERNEFKFQIEELKKLQETYHTKNELLKEELEVLEEVIRDRKKTIDAIRRLDSLDISEKEVAEWSLFLKEIGYDIKEFRDMLETVNGLPGYLELKTRDINELEKKEAHLKSNITELETELKALKIILDNLSDSVRSDTEKIRAILTEFEEYFTSDEHGFKTRSRVILDDITENLTLQLGETKKSWNKDMNTLEKNVDKILEETERILENAYKGGRIVGRFHSLEPIHNIIRDEKVPRIEATIGVITMLTYIQKWLKQNTDIDVQSFDQIKNKLMEDLGDIY